MLTVIQLLMTEERSKPYRWQPFNSDEGGRNEHPVG